MWVWVHEAAEISAIGEFGVGDDIAWTCREPGSAQIDLPSDVEPSDVMFEDADYGLGVLHDEWVDVTGRISEVRAAVDEWIKEPGGPMWTVVPGTREWRSVLRNKEIGPAPQSGLSGFLIQLTGTDG